jgi:hypothetical protein
MLQRIAGLLLVALLMTGCGGSGSSSSSSSTPGQAQGVFFGTTSTGKVFESIVLPSDKFYALYGCSGNTWCPTSVDNTFWMDGFVAGQGNSNNGTYTASTIDYYYGSAIAGSVNASYVAGASFQGSLLESASISTQQHACLISREPGRELSTLQGQVQRLLSLMVLLQALTMMAAHSLELLVLTLPAKTSLM